MSLISLITDFGEGSIYAAQSKLWLYANLPDVKLVEISHTIDPSDVHNGAYAFELLLSHHTESTIHIIAIDFDERVHHQEILIAKHQNQYIITYNSGFLPLLGIDCLNSEIWMAKTYSGNHFLSIVECFGHLAKDILNKNLNNYSKLDHQKLRLLNAQKPTFADNLLRGKIIFVDSREYAYTNIHQTDFDEFKGSKDFNILLGRHVKINHINQSTELMAGGKTYCFFNSAGYLTIGVYRDSTKKMYNLQKDSIILIEKE
ncbi:MAG: SAM-dependent chlorinase/fluorinase [Flavobacteriales bacterium]|nr:SAM-dependent chlorinase/fluorinase [Flavobacteriales bacterium]